MGKYVIKRVLMIIPMMLVVMAIIFALGSVSTVLPGRTKLGAEATEQQVYEYNRALGLFDPLPIRYIRYICNIVRGDFGTSYYYERPVFELIMNRWPNTIRLTVTSLIIAMSLGIPIGILSAVKQYSFIDRFASILAMLLAAIPVFCMATIYMLVFSYKLRLVPASGITMGWKSWILPCLTLGVFYSARFLRFTRSTMLETIRQDYVRTARAKGAYEKNVIWTHAFRNALLPLITITGTNLGVLLGGAVVIESVFVIPGLGSMVVESLARNDTPLTMAAISMLAFTFLSIMLAVDLLYAVVDPRIRAIYQSRDKKKHPKKEKKTEVA